MMDGGTNIFRTNLIFFFLQLPAVKAVTEESTFLERWELDRKPEGLSDYFSLLFDAADRKKISSYKLSNYDRMQRDEIQIEAEKRYAVEEAREGASLCYKIIRMQGRTQHNRLDVNSVSFMHL